MSNYKTAHFNDNQKQATRNAAQMAGFDFVRIMTEPVAAALAHDITMYDVKKEIMVFDLGGGTFDVSLLSLQKTEAGPIFAVKAIYGDSHLGGGKERPPLFFLLSRAILNRSSQRTSITVW